MPGRSLSPRRLPQRSRSFDMKGLLHRSLSFSSKRSSHSTNARDEQNVFCADIVTSEFIRDKLAEVKDNTEVTKLEIEDLLTSSHQTVLPMIKDLIVSGKREWQRVRFVETMVDPDDFATWQRRQQGMMQDLRSGSNHEDAQTNVVSFDATIRIPQGTASSVLLGILQSLRKDGGKTISKVTFEGALFGVEKAVLPATLSKSIDPVSGETTDEISIAILSGFSASYSDNADQDWKMILMRCIRHLQQPQESSARPLIRRARTAEAPRSQAMMKRHQSFRRLKSTTDDGSAPLRRPQRTVSMPLRKRESRKAVADGGDSDASSSSSSRTGRPVHRRPRRHTDSVRATREGKAGNTTGAPTTRHSRRALGSKSARSISSPPSKPSRGRLQLESLPQDDTIAKLSESPDYDWKTGVYLKSHASKAA